MRQALESVTLTGCDDGDDWPRSKMTQDGLSAGLIGGDFSAGIGSGKMTLI